MRKKVVVVGGGPAGLTAAYELLRQSEGEYDLILLERDKTYLGGISKTVNYKGYKIDIGGHRFFSKSEEVVNWWLSFLPLQGAPALDDKLLNRTPPYLAPEGPDPDKVDEVMLVRRRLSRIFYRNKFFDYPISLSLDTLRKLGPYKVFKIGFTYLWARIFPRKPERTLEDFFINRFGWELYNTFFREYTEKVWGIPPSELSAEWGAQRVKGLSVTKVLLNALRKIFSRDTSLLQKKTETSLIEQFMYPKYGPGQLWTLVGRKVEELGGKILLGSEAVGVILKGNKVQKVIIRDSMGEEKSLDVDILISSMPLRDLVLSFRVEDRSIPPEVVEIAKGLMYRDFITVGLLLSRLRWKKDKDIPTFNNLLPDNWIYIQEPGFKVGRLQLFNNWSPYLLKDYNKVWIGMEYFANRGDSLWSLKDEEMIRLAVDELKRLKGIKDEDFEDGVVIRTLNTYPVYAGTYSRFHILREYLDSIENLYLIGRTGMHRYNNQDHSMLTAMEAVKNIIHGVKDKENIWKVNTEQEYHEEKGGERSE